MTNTRIDRKEWSPSSKQSSVIHSGSTCYEDIHYTCSKCKTAAVFSAEEQKRSFEVKKNYIWQRRTLCPACNAELFRLRTRERHCQMRWANERKELGRDGLFIREWLEVLQTIPQYAPSYQNSMRKRLATLLQQLADPASIASSLESPAL